jgi:hypothetical protein
MQSKQALVERTERPFDKLRAKNENERRYEIKRAEN